MPTGPEVSSGLVPRIPLTARSTSASTRARMGTRAFQIHSTQFTSILAIRDLVLYQARNVFYAGFP